MSTTLVVARRQLYDDTAGYGWAFSLTLQSSYGTGDIKTIDPRLLYLGANAVSEDYRGSFAFRPDRSAGDTKRMLDSLSVAAGVATITHFGPAWSDHADTNGEIVGMDPDELIRMFGDALDQLKVDCFVPLGHGPLDLDFQASTTSNWSDTNATSAKQTTNTEVPIAARGLSLTLSGANGYTQSALQNIGAGQGFTIHCVARADTGGPAIYRYVDASSATMDSITITEREFMYGTKHIVSSTSNRQMRARLMGTANLDQIDWGAAWYVKDGETTFKAPSWMGEKDELVGIAVGIPKMSGPDANTWYYRSFDFDEIKEGVQYSFHRRYGDANPYMVEILDRSLMGRPLFFIVSSPYSAPYGVAQSFAAESDTTTCPMDLLMAQMKILLGDRYGDRFGPIGDPPESLLQKGTREKIAALTRHLDSEPVKEFGWSRTYRGAL